MGAAWAEQQQQQQQPRRGGGLRRHGVPNGSAEGRAGEGRLSVVCGLTFQSAPKCTKVPSRVVSIFLPPLGTRGTGRVPCRATRPY